MPNLTKRFIDSILVTRKREIYWDSGLKGFGLLVLPSEVRSFVYDYRNADVRKRRITIGRFGAITVEQARTQAQALAGRVAKGEDPAATIALRRAAPTINDLLDDYLSKHVEAVNAPRTQELVKSIVENHIRPALGALKVSALTRQDVLRLRQRMSTTRRLANLTLAALSKALALAEEWGWRPEGSNPCRRVPRYEENARERFLSADELARVGRAMEEAETIGLPWTERENAIAKHRAKPENRRAHVNASALAAIRLLLFTGARVSEILEAKWSDVDFERGTIALPSRKGGARRPHPVSAAALAILDQAPHVKGSRWIFPAPTNPEASLSRFVVGSVWERVRAAAGVSDVRVHDLRHTAATLVSQGGANAFLVRDFLRHKTLKMTSLYANYDADPIRDVAEGLAKRISAGLAGGATVIALKTPKRP